MSQGLAAVMARVEEIRAAFGTRRSAATSTRSGASFDDALRSAAGTPNPQGKTATSAASGSTSASSNAAVGSSSPVRSKSTATTKAGGKGWPAGVPEDAEQFRDEFEAASAETGVPLNVLLAVSWAESAFNPDAESSAGALGLMQLMPATAESLGVDPRDPAQNILGGARYLAQQYESFGSWDLAFAAYNAGPGAVDRYGGIPPYAETQNYVAVIEGYLDRIAAAGPTTTSNTTHAAKAPEQPTVAAQTTGGTNTTQPSTVSSFALSGALDALATPLESYALQRAQSVDAAGNLSSVGGEVSLVSATQTGVLVAPLSGGLLSGALPTETVAATSLPDRLVALVQRAKEGGQSAHRVTLRLDPPDLGAVSVRLELRGNDVAVSLRAERADASALLNAQRDRVAALLQREGLQLSGFDVHADSGANQSGAWSRRSAGTGGHARLDQIDLDTSAQVQLAFERGLRL